MGVWPLRLIHHPIMARKCHEFKSIWVFRGESNPPPWLWPTKRSVGPNLHHVRSLFSELQLSTPFISFTSPKNTKRNCTGNGKHLRQQLSFNAESFSTSSTWAFLSKIYRSENAIEMNECAMFMRLEHFVISNVLHIIHFDPILNGLHSGDFLATESLPAKLLRALNFGCKVRANNASLFVSLSARHSPLTSLTEGMNKVFFP